MNFKCNEIECIRERQEIMESFPLHTDTAGAVIDDSDDENHCRNDFIHCEMPGCHSNYWSDKNGRTCSLCENENCEGCADDGGYEDSDEEDSFGGEWLCKDCLKERLSISKKDRKRRRKEEQLESLKRMKLLNNMYKK